MKAPTPFLAIIAVGILMAAAGAELKIWTDVDGKTIEAEHIATLNGQVVVRKADRTELRVSLDSLCEADRRYAVLRTPPRLEINVSLRHNRSNKGNGRAKQITDETITVTVELKKRSPSPYDAPLIGELYLIGAGAESEKYIVLDRVASEFRFSSKNSAAHAFESNEVNLKQVQRGQKRGVAYAGYLLAVRDESGEIIAFKCSRLAFEKNSAALLGAANGDVFDEEFNQLSRKTSKVEGRTPKKPKNIVPGRRF